MKLEIKPEIAVYLENTAKKLHIKFLEYKQTIPRVKSLASNFALPNNKENLLICKLPKG